MRIEELYNEAVELLKQLISTPSLSKEEDKAASIIQSFLHSHSIASHRYLNNVWATTNNYDRSKPTLFLNSHHDTVKPNPQYTKDPFNPIIEDGKLFGLGSNDAGGCLVSLILVFLHYYNQRNLKYNLVLAATAEEEISGKKGIEAVLKNENFLNSVMWNTEPLFKDWIGIVGEPTKNGPCHC